ncbi:type II toxin-antitoxin system YafO family toxin [Klebsiella quasipneumoniae]|uniref:type II toxin-antitoxin system YafO family toxin n=1 Tax=Klebsiella quasipneumoniae TaxID=1463165 RepID=UPI003D6634DF
MCSRSATGSHSHQITEEAPWPHGLPDRQKKSNTYLVYAQHMWDPSRFSILALVTPAHDLMSVENTQLISRFSQYAENFHSR